VTLSALFGMIVGVVAAGLWWRASRISWTVGREPGMLSGDYGPRKSGFFGKKTHYAAGGIEPYLNDVSKWNSRAALVTALATALPMICWAVQTIADLWTRAATH
jgi:hypothetical protein